jgi:hypothetical protein
MLDGMSEADILEFNIPTGVPIVYDLAPDLTLTRSGDSWWGTPPPSPRPLRPSPNKPRKNSRDDLRIAPPPYPVPGNRRGLPAAIRLTRQGRPASFEAIQRIPVNVT